MVQSVFQKSLLTIVMLVIANGIAFAEVISAPNTPLPKTTSAVSNQIKQKNATLNFEDELVEGSTQKPELFYLFQKKNFNYKRLIKLRENFLPEMRKTTEDIQRVRSMN